MKEKSNQGANDDRRYEEPPKRRQLQEENQGHSHRENKPGGSGAYRELVHADTRMVVSVSHIPPNTILVLSVKAWRPKQPFYIADSLRMCAPKLRPAHVLGSP